VLLSVGDMGWLNPPYAQLLDVPYGKVLRLTSDEIAAGQQVDAHSLEIVAYGLRNPWRMSLDRASGDLWIGDVGAERFEEVDRLAAADLHDPPENFGWPSIEGRTTYRDAGAVDPIGPRLVRPHSADVCAVIGGYVYRGKRIPALGGRYLFGDFCSREVRAVDASDTAAEPAETVIATLPETVVGFGQLANGELWISGAENGLYRLDPSSWRPPDDDQTVPGPPPVTVSTIPPAAPPCDVIATLTDLADLESLSPAKVQATLDRVIELLDLVSSTAPPGLKADLATVHSAFSDMRALASDVGWDATSPRFSTFRASLIMPDGPYPGFGAAFSRVLETSNVAC
jgi:hypothetical protein